MKVLVVLSALVACSLAKPGVFAPAAVGYSGIAPLAYAAHAPVIAAAPAVTYAAHAPVVHAASVAVAPAALRTQYHAQDVLGQASYGHAEPLQAHHAVQDAAGNKVGSFSYVSPEGAVLRTDYVADGLGYRVASNALPVGPAAVVDTPAVVAAKAAHLAAHHVVRRQVVLGHTPAATAPLVHSVVATPLAHSVVASPLAHSVVAPGLTYAAAAPVAYSVPAIRPATLTTVVNTPGHAVSYRVD